MGITIYIHSHTITRPPVGDTHCWTYISQGLAQVNQPEVVFTLRRRDNENEEQFPAAPVEWARAVFALAAGGLNLEAGQMCNLEFDDNGMLIRLKEFIIRQPLTAWESMRRFGALVHGIRLSDCIFGFPDGTLPQRAHNVIALTHEEAAVASQFGCTRVIGHIGLSVRWFPYPPWIDRDRADCVVMADQSRSIRTRLPVARIYGLNAMLEGDEIVLTIPREEKTRELFRTHILGSSLSEAVAFESFMVEEADSGLLWKCGQRQPRGYGRDCESDAVSRCMNLAFIAFAPTGNNDKSIMVEDGYSLLLKESTWKSIRDAVGNTRDIVIDLDEGMRFQLFWQKSVYRNPIDGAEYEADWISYRPRGRPAPPISDSHVQLKQVIFLVQPPDGHVGIEDFISYTKGIGVMLEKSISVTPLRNSEGAPLWCGIVVEIEIPKCAGWLKLSAFPSMDGLPTQQILSKVATITQPRCLSRARFQLVFSLWGYDGPMVSLRFS